MDDDAELRALRAAAIQSMLNKKEPGVREIPQPVSEQESAYQPQRQDHYNGHHTVRPLFVPYPHPGPNRNLFQQMLPYAMPYYGQQSQMPPCGPFAGPQLHHTSNAHYHHPAPFRHHRFPIHRHRHPYQHQNNSLLHQQPQFMNHYTNNDRSSVLRNERRTGSPGTVPEKESDSSQEEEKRLPGRFSRIDRSDSESEEDDRLDEFIDSDLDEDRHHATSEAEEHTSHSPETRPLSPIRKEPQSENEGDHNIGGETIDTESKAHSGEGKADDALSDLEVPDTDAITFEVDEDDDLETTLKDILDGKTASPEQIPAVADCKPDLFVDHNSHNSCKELKSDPEPLSQSLAESDAIVVRDEPKSPQMERKTIRLKQSNNEDPLERRKRKFGLTDPVSETRAASPPPPDKVSAAGGWRKKGGRKNASNCTIDPNEATSSTTSTKRIRSFVVRKT